MRFLVKLAMLGELALAGKLNTTLVTSWLNECALASEITVLSQLTFSWKAKHYTSLTS